MEAVNSIPRGHRHDLHNFLVPDMDMEDDLSSESDSLMTNDLTETSMDLEETSSKNDLEKHFKSDPNDPDPIVRVVGCHINVRKNGDMEVNVPNDPEMSKKLTHLLHLRLGKNIFEASKNPLNFKHSNLSTISELENVENQLQNPIVKHKMGEYFGLYKEPTTTKSVEKALSTLMTNELAMECNWGGQKGKKGLKTLTITTLLIDAILKLDPSSTVYELEEIIKAWLKQAPLRLQNSRRMENQI